MSAAVRWALAALVTALALLHFPATADDRVMEVIDLKHRVLGDVLPTLRELVAEGGTVTGMHNQLIIRTTPANLADLKHVLDRLDSPVRQLRITVRQGIDSDIRYREDALAARGRAGNVSAEVGRVRGGPGLGVSVGGEDAAVAYRNYSTREQDDTAHSHFVTTLEGSPAFISAGQAVPLADRNLVWSPYGATIYDSVNYRDVGAGFYVTPRLSGDGRVTLQIASHADSLGRQGGGAIDTRGVDTVVSGRVGEWIPLGGAAQSAARGDSGIAWRTRESGRDNYDVSVKVDVIR